jgi:hypothetical protein
MTQLEAATQSRPSQRLLVVIGVLWLLLAAAIVVSQFSQATPIRIDWETETEINTAGFNVYRSETSDGEYRRLNDRLIPGEGNPVSGANYSFVDRNVVAGKTYFYRLEDVELDNSTSQHEVIEYTAPLVSWWVPIVVALSIFCGLFLIVRGLRQEKNL